LDKTIPFGAQSHPEVVRFSPDGTVMVTGSVDGFLEVWDVLQGKLKALPYQEEDKFMMHEAAILSLSFTKDGEHLVSGSQDGQIKVWQIRTGRCLRAFPTAHAKGVTSVRFSRDGFKVLSTSFDTTVRIHGLKSGKTLKILRGHSSYVNDAVWATNGAQVVSGGSDGTVRLWDASTTECITSFHVGNAAVETAIQAVMLLPRNQEQLVVCNRSNTIYILTLQGATIKTFSNGKDKEGDFLAAALSPKGDWLYGVAEDRMLYCFSLASGKLEHMLKVSERETIGLDHHPHANLVCSYDDEGNVKLWRA
jgi:WD40 repeat-containing protein SMU1